MKSLLHSSYSSDVSGIRLGMSGDGNIYSCVSTANLQSVIRLNGHLLMIPVIQGMSIMMLLVHINSVPSLVAA